MLKKASVGLMMSGVLCGREEGRIVFINFEIIYGWAEEIKLKKTFLCRCQAIIDTVP